MTENDATPADGIRYAEIAWERRPDGGRLFTPSARHLYDASVDLDSAPSLNTLCGTTVPLQVLREMRGGRRPIAAAAILMDQRDLADARPCTRCARAASNGAEAAR